MVLDTLERNRCLVVQPFTLPNIAQYVAYPLIDSYLDIKPTLQAFSTSSTVTQEYIPKNCYIFSTALMTSSKVMHSNPFRVVVRIPPCRGWKRRYVSHLDLVPNSESIKLTFW